MLKDKLILISRILLVSWTLLIVVLLLKPQGFYRGVILFKGEDILYHYCLFTIWSSLLFFLYYLSSKPVRIILLLTIVMGVVLGGTTEFAQQFIPNRYAQLDDFVADIAGTFTGFLGAFILKKRLDRIAKKYES